MELREARCTCLTAMTTCVAKSLRRVWTVTGRWLVGEERAEHFPILKFCSSVFEMLAGGQQNNPCRCSSRFYSHDGLHKLSLSPWRPRPGRANPPQPLPPHLHPQPPTAVYSRYPMESSQPPLTGSPACKTSLNSDHPAKNRIFSLWFSPDPCLPTIENLAPPHLPIQVLSISRIGYPFRHPHNQLASTQKRHSLYRPFLARRKDHRYRWDAGEWHYMYCLF